MAEEKTPKPKIELGDKSAPAAGAGANQDAGKKASDDGSYTVGEAVRDGSARLFAWVRRTFPGHEHAFWGGVLGFVAAILFLVLGLFKALVILALVIPLYNIQGVILLTVKERRGRFRLSSVLLNVLKNPMILAVLAALPFAYFKIQLPFVVSESLGYFQAATNTMALLVVGGSIRLSALKSDLPLLLRLSGVKLLVMPAIWAAMGIAAGLPAEQLVTLIIVGAMPAAVNVYIITDKMGGDGELACSAVVVTHLVSLFTMTGVVFCLRMAGLI